MADGTEPEGKRQTHIAAENDHRRKHRAPTRKKRTDFGIEAYFRAARSLKRKAKPGRYSLSQQP